MARQDRDSSIDASGAIEVLRERLSEFGKDIDEHLAFAEGESLLHVLMGDLARCYVRCALNNEDLRQRYRMAVEWLASRGDSDVQNAIGASLIEWFASGDQRERKLLVDAKPLMSGTVMSIADEFLRAGGYDQHGRARA